MEDFSVGIDLGTTNSCIAVLKNGRVDIIENERGSRVTPSWVTFTDNQVLTGIESVEEAHKYMKTTIFEAKRLIGQQFSNEKVQADVKRFPYEVFNDLGTPKIRVDENREYYAEEISGYILRTLRSFAENRLNTTINRAVVTVPAYFSDPQRQATKDAAEIAGFKNVTVLNEPTAAALAFNYDNQKPYKRNVLVYDFGGGTFDVSVVTVEQTKCDVRSTNGDCHLGGTDIDMNLVDFIKKSFEEKYNGKLENDPATFRRLKNVCENAKKKLSAQYNVDIELDNLGGRDFNNFHLSRARFEQLNGKLFDKTMAILDECLKSSGITKERIDSVLLVGGSSRIPKIQEMLKEYFGGDKVSKGVNPDEAVAYGAAIYANSLSGNKHEVTDVTPLSVGTNTYGDLMSVIIPRNTPIPANSKKCYQTIMDNQTTMEFPIYQGEREIASENFELGNFTMTGLTEAPAKQVRVQVCYSIDYEGLLHISAKELNSNNTKDIVIDIQKRGLSKQQIAERFKEAEQWKAQDKKRSDFARQKHALESALNDLIKHADNCNAGDEEKLREKHGSVWKWLEKVKIDDVEQMTKYTEEVQKLILDTPAD